MLWLVLPGGFMALLALFGHLRGGLLQVAIVGMYVASSMSGSKAADMRRSASR